MAWDEERAATVVRRTLPRMDVPPSRVDLDAVLVAGRRAERRRRRLTVTLAAATVLAVGLGSAAVLGRDGHGRGMDRVTDRPPEILPTPTVVPLTARRSGAPAPCVYQELPAPAGVRLGRVQAADPTGRFVAGTAVAGGAAGRSASRLVLWDRRQPVLADIPTEGGGFTDVVAVNPDGVVVGTTSSPEAGRSGRMRSVPWVYREGRVRELAVPAGYDEATVQAVNRRGDVLGLAQILASRTSAVVVWPAGTDGAPRMLNDGVAGRVIGWGDDGTVVTVGPADPAGQTASRELLLLRADGTRVVLPLPSGWAPGTSWGDRMPMRGDWLGGILPGATEKSPPAVLNLRTGQLVVYRGLDTRNHFTVVVGPDGRLLVGEPGTGWKLVEHDGTVRAVPLPPGANPEYGPQPVMVDDTGAIHGTARFDDPDPASSRGEQPMTWRCD
ncbi:hypothetical protein [Micromonospora maritima]|uniref:hypothetical protein n=1 Tax=Micromonospora maritima TaxID=986711 RepID=UPI0037A3ED9A